MNDEEILRIKERAQKELLKIPGVHAVGIGAKEKGDTATGEISIRVYVVRKKPLSAIPPNERIPPEIDGIPTDVYESETPTTLQVAGVNPPFLQDVERYRPLRGGIQINRLGKGSGTLGFFMTVEGNPGLILGVTNHHVLYSTCADTPDNEAVGQPTESDSCTDCCSSAIGRVHRSICDEDLDISLIALSSGQQWLAEVQQMGFITGGFFVTAAEAAAGTYQVKKRGRTTGLTGGVVTDLELTGTINNHDGTLFRAYDHVMGIRPNPDGGGNPAQFAAPGDSGSAVVNDAGQVVALLFGTVLSPGGTSFAIPLDLIVAKFDLMPGAERLELRVASATASNDVRVVPRVAIDPVVSPVVVSSPSVSPVPQLEDDLSGTEAGRWFVDAYLKHAREVREMINSNRRVATVWHRSGAAELFQIMVNVFRRRDTRVPDLVQGRPVHAILDQFSAVLCQFGSVALREDLARAAPALPSVVGLTYVEILARLEQLSLHEVPAA